MMKALIHTLKCGVVISMLLLMATHFGCTGADNEKKDQADQEQAVVDTSGSNASEVGTPGIATENEIEATENKTAEITTEKVRGPENIATTEKSKTSKVKNDASVKVPAKDAKNEPVKTTEDKPEASPEPTVEKTDKPVDDKPTKIEEPIKKEPENNPPKPATADQSNNWVVPESDRNKANPVAKNSESVNAGKVLYQKHCASCHGKKGKGDGPKAAQLKTDSGDFTDPKVQEQTDGALFYKTRQGRDDMPSFKKKIPDQEEIWHLVNYLRTFK